MGADQAPPPVPERQVRAAAGVIHGSPHGIDVPFFLAESCTIEYCVAFHPDDDCASTKAEITERLERAAQLDPWLREHPPTIEWKLEWEPYRLDADHAILPALAQAHERAAEGTKLAGPAVQRGFGGVCDVTWYDRAGIPSVIYGPGDLRLAHASNEWVDVDEVVTSCKAFALLALDWCGEAAS